ncbi:MAG: glycine zipper 2TM domain-containing protein [Rhodocyclaceae bacterium]|nr:glycine zipper 2TM domain-containing protein [Rhodocyclaceae bacterium]
MNTQPSARSASIRVSVLLAAGLLAACASPPLVREYPSRVPPAASPPAPPAIYPARGQDARQLARDRFECYGWAVQQSGFDPARALVRLPRPALRVDADPPAGVGTAAGVLTGAAIGAAVSSPHHSGEAAVVGAVLGGIVGAASDSAREAEARRIESELNRRAAREGALDARGQAYQRAFSACLEGRGYTVK